VVMLKHIKTVALATVLAGCAVTAPPITTSSNAAISGKFTPPAGKAIFAVGQDLDDIEAYMKGFQTETAGVASITSLEKLEGLTEEAETSAGKLHTDFLMTRHPFSVLVLSVGINGYLDKVNSGAADAQIEKLLTVLGGYQRPVYLRLGAFFDDAANGLDPAAFKQAWKKVADRLRAKNIQNIALVWQSASACDGKPAGDFYPGDDVVDWVGLSFTNQVKCNYKPVDDMLAFARAHKKPVMVESYPIGYSLSKNTFAGQARTNAQIWNEWFGALLDTVYRNNDAIRAVVYETVTWEKWPATAGQNRGDSSLQSNPELVRHWVAEMSRDQWILPSPDFYKNLGYEAKK